MFDSDKCLRVENKLDTNFLFLSLSPQRGPKVLALEVGNRRLFLQKQTIHVLFVGIIGPFWEHRALFRNKIENIGPDKDRNTPHNNIESKVSRIEDSYEDSSIFS